MVVYKTRGSPDLDRLLPLANEDVGLSQFGDDLLVRVVSLAPCRRPFGLRKKRFVRNGKTI
jgi:hypothetical protein